MSKILIVFAQGAEAAATIRHLEATPVPGEMAHIWSEGLIPCCYQFEQGHIVISNVGIHYAQMAITRYAHLAGEVWNLGLAGSLKEGQPIGALLTVGTVGKYLPHDQENFSLPPFALKGSGKLISSDFPIHDHTHRQRLSQAWDVVDMEGYGIAFACTHLNKPCKMFKIVSDFASPGGRELIRTHKAELSERMANTVREMLHFS
jgi:adenosylhomocysteine nucleosidase